MGAGGGVKMGVEECIHQCGLTYTCLSCKFVEWSILKFLFTLHQNGWFSTSKTIKFFKREFETETREKCEATLTQTEDIEAESLGHRLVDQLVRETVKTHMTIQSHVSDPDRMWGLAGLQK